MKSIQTAGQQVKIHEYNTVIVGAGAAGMNCAVHLCEMMSGKGVPDAESRIAVVTAGVELGASRMSGSDKQTYYKMGTSPDVADSAEEFAKSLTAGGCCHEDLALAEAIGSLREFYHLVQAGVPFPTDSMGTFVGYKTDHDPYERATSAGPKTSKFMSECLQKQAVRYGIEIFNKQEAVKLLTAGEGDAKRIIGVATIDKKRLGDGDYALNVFLARNMVLAAGGPGELYETSVYPHGQLGIHGLAFEAGLTAENLTESQFGLASTKFRWNVSGTYMQAIPRIFSTDAEGGDEREFLAGFFPSMSSMATNIFLKGYQWPFDPQKIEDHQSSLVDILVFNETQKGRRVFMDFRVNPVGSGLMEKFDLEKLGSEARDYLEKAGAFQATPIERLSHMNPLAIDIYAENGIDLHTEPLEIAVCAQHNNGGFAVDKWWQSSVKGTFVIGEMAGTHGVKRPGGSALNAGQTGGLRASEYIVNTGSCEAVDWASYTDTLDEQLNEVVAGLDKAAESDGPAAKDVIAEIQSRMTASGGHLRRLEDAKKALQDALGLYRRIRADGVRTESPKSLIKAVQAEHLALTSVAYLRAIVDLLERGEGSRGSHLVLDGDGIEIHPDVTDQSTGDPLRYKPENESLRDAIQWVRYNADSADIFECGQTTPRRVSGERKAFEPAWRDYREGRIYEL